jgi:hypothetical protein
LLTDPDIFLFNFIISNSDFNQTSSCLSEIRKGLDPIGSDLCVSDVGNVWIQLDQIHFFRGQKKILYPIERDQTRVR